MAFDLLSVEEDVHAAAQGWALRPVYDLGVRKWLIRILPARFAPPIDNCEKAGAVALNFARNGDTVALKALRLVMHGNMKT